METQNVILEAIQNGPKSVMDLNKELGIKWTILATVARDMQQNGLITIVNGHIALPGHHDVATDRFGVPQETEVKSTTKGSVTKPSNGSKAKRGPKGGGNSKTAIAKQIYDRMIGQSRKAVIDQFVSEAGLTPAGASTYYANFKRQQV